MEGHMISLVTGGCGFIGSHMVDRLLEEGHEVRVIDNWTTGRPENLSHQKDNENLKIYHMDIRNKEEIAPVFQEWTISFTLRRWLISYRQSSGRTIIIHQMCWGHSMWWSVPRMPGSKACVCGIVVLLWHTR